LILNDIKIDDNAYNFKTNTQRNTLFKKEEFINYEKSLENTNSNTNSHNK